VRALTIFVWLLLASGIHAQDGKGIESPVQAAQKRGTVRALVVGISNYQQVPSLHFADRDAEEFARYLQRNEAWKLPASNIVLLTNEGAKAGDILSSLSWLQESSKAGDEVVFYFSGHGDVETKADSSKGFLLAHDSPRNNYVTGAIPVTLMQDVFIRMIQKGIKVFLVTDACRSGHLAGGAAGVQQTAQAFSNQWRNEVKYLSAQPNELSYEGKEWGEGRGVFSFFLMKGLNGFADLNKDSVITQMELEQYVGLQVAQATGFKQQPVFSGPDKYTRLVAHADPAEMERYSKWTGDGAITVLTTAPPVQQGKGAEQVDSSCPAYLKLLAAIEKMGLDSARSLALVADYENIGTCKQDLMLKGRLKLSAALMNSVQEIVNQTLIGYKVARREELETALYQLDILFRISKDYPLIYHAHWVNMYRFIQVTISIQLEPEEAITYSREKKLEAGIDSALLSEPNAPYLLEAKGICFAYDRNTDRQDSAVAYFRKAVVASPTWLLPKLLIGQSFERMHLIDSAMKWYQKIEMLDTAYRKFECSVCFFDNLGDIYLKRKEWAKAISSYEKVLERDTFRYNSILGLARAWKARKNPSEVKKWIARLESLDSAIDYKLEVLEDLMEHDLVSSKEAFSRYARAFSKQRQAWQGDPVSKKMADEVEPYLIYISALMRQKYGGPGSGTFLSAFEKSLGGPYELRCRIGYYQEMFEKGQINEKLRDGIRQTISSMADKLTIGQKNALTLLDAFCLWFTNDSGEMIESAAEFTQELSPDQQAALKKFSELIKAETIDCATMREFFAQKPFKTMTAVNEWVKANCR
jgi:tetratricopeptide (TPR) repeat protein